MPACCTTRPTGHTNAEDSKSRWMKLQWQVNTNMCRKTKPALLDADGR
jgi:hypothetical protein